MSPNNQDVKAGSAEWRVVRCAIYARKSTEEGLSQPCNSLDVQRESAEAYISSQRHLGWTVLERRYDDGGYTGANLERPALRALMEDIQSGQVDCVLVYKVDRLSRSLLDFARLMGIFEERGVHLVSVTQQMNTTNSLVPSGTSCQGRHSRSRARHCFRHDTQQLTTTFTGELALACPVEFAAPPG